MLDDINLHFARQDFSQFGEAGVLGWLFHGKRDGFYVDVGCHHPFRFSNTATLHLQAGWRGINIDLDERSIAAFEQYRPDDINLVLGVANTVGQMEATIFDEGAVNTFDQAAANHPAWAHIARRKQLVAVLPLSEILQKHLPDGQKIDLLNVDAEGLDYEILISNNWDLYTPSAIAIEVHDFDLASAAEHRTYKFLASKGYRLISHCAVTSIYSR